MRKRRRRPRSRSSSSAAEASPRKTTNPRGEHLSRRGEVLSSAGQRASEGDGANPYGLGQGLELGDQAGVAGVVEVGDHVAQGSTRTEHLSGDVHVVVADDGVEPGPYTRNVAVQV